MDLKRIAALRGIENLYTFLAENGFVHSTASKLGREKLSSIKISQIGRLCVLLNCTPNDLFEWREDAENPISETHALRSIIRDNTQRKSLREIVKDVPIDKMLEIERLLKGGEDG